MMRSRHKIVVTVLLVLTLTGLVSTVPFAESYTGQKIAEIMSSPLPSAPEPVLQGGDFPVHVKDLSEALAGSGDASAWSGEIGSMYGRYTLSLVNGTLDGEKWVLYFNVPSEAHTGLYDLTLTQSSGGASEGVFQSRCVWVLDEWPESLIISHLTDIHEPIEPLIFSQYIMQSNFVDPDLGICSGDNVQTESVARAWAYLQYSMLHLEFPSYLLPGNHDYSGYGGAAYAKYGGKLNYTVVIGDFMFVALDSRGVGTVTEKQLRWAENQLSKHPDKVKIISFHHPLLSSEYEDDLGTVTGGSITGDWQNIEELKDIMYPSWTDPTDGHPLEVAKTLLRIIQEQDVRLILSGHVHRDIIYVLNDSHYFVTTSTTGGGLPPGQRFGTRLITVHQNGTLRFDPYTEARLDDPPNNIPTGYLRYVYGSANDFTETAVSVTLENMLDMGFPEGRLIFKVSDSKPVTEYTFVGAQPVRVETATSDAGHVFDAYFDVEPKSVLEVTLKAEDDEETPTIEAEFIIADDGADPTVSLTMSDSGWGLKEAEASYSTNGGLTWTPIDTSIEPVLGGEEYDVTFPEKTFTFTVPLALGETILVKAEATDYAGNTGSYTSPEFSPQSYTLSVESTPIEVSFTVDGEDAETPYYETLMAGEYTLTAPETVTVGGEEYSFSWWADGETELSRTIDLGADTELSVISQKVEAPEEPSEPEETGGGIPVPSEFLLVGILLAAVTLGYLRSGNEFT
jgi:3',5'-cyclic AMP phosphodiesterase CpdA